MSKGKKTALISGCIIGLAIIMVGLGILIKSRLPKTYSSAKKECEKVLAGHQVEMERIAVEALESNAPASGEFEEYSYSCQIKEGLVPFDIGAQGWLGGQYWELIYTQDGTLYGETESYLYKEPNGNNIIRAEKIGDHWWYCWTDYDGTGKSYQ